MEKKVTQTIVAKKQSAKKKSIPIFDMKGTVTGTIDLPDGIFAVSASPKLLSLYVRVYLNNQKFNVATTKSRSAVKGSTRKIYRQKGTGRARHGDIKAPIFVGGGIAHGPKPRDYSLKISQQMKKLALFGALSEKFRLGKLQVITGLAEIEAKTKKMMEVLADLGLWQKKNKKQEKTLLLHYSKTRNIYLAGRNISFLKPVFLTNLNTYEILKHQNLLLTTDALQSI